MVRYTTKQGKEKVRLYISKTDIKLGERYASHGCPIARALQRNFKTKDASMGLSFASANGYVYKVCDIGRKFRYKFDNNPTLPPDPCRIILTKV